MTLYDAAGCDIYVMACVKPIAQREDTQQPTTREKNTRQHDTTVQCFQLHLRPTAFLASSRQTSHSQYTLITILVPMTVAENLVDCGCMHNPPVVYKTQLVYLSMHAGVSRFSDAPGPSVYRKTGQRMPFLL